MKSGGPSVAIVGATGAVGVEFLRILEERRFPHREIRLLSSARSAGSRVRYRGAEVEVAEAGAGAFDGVDVALFSAGGSVSKALGPVAVEAGAVVVDNSSAFRMAPGVALVIPEINGARVRESSEPRIIANPNCSTIIMMMAVHPLRERFGVDRIVVSTYQAVSGAGAAGMVELERMTRAALEGRDEAPEKFGEDCAFNVFSHDSPVDPATGRNVEEQKMIDESRKIWEDPGVRVAATCVRVPVMRAHTESINVTLRDPATEADVRDALGSMPGVTVMDDRAGNRFPTPRRASGIDDCLVGRVRGDESQEVIAGPDGETRFRGFDLLISGDQLRKGAALNAVQIAELLCA